MDVLQIMRYVDAPAHDSEIIYKIWYLIFSIF